MSYPTNLSQKRNCKVIIPKIKAVIFDLDGLLVDSEPIHFQTNQIFWQRYGKKFTQAHLKKFMGKRIDEEIEELSSTWNISTQTTQLITERETLFQKLIQKSLGLTSGVKNILTFLKNRHILMGIGSSSHSWYVNFALHKFGINSYFHTVVTGSDVTHGKPHPETYLTVAHNLSKIPSECLVLEDAVNGVQAAKVAGMYCFAIPGPYHDQSKFVLADGVFSSLIQVKKYLESKFNNWLII